MAFDSETIQGILGKEDLTNENKVELLLAEHKAAQTGLLAKRDELLGQERALKDKLKAQETKLTEALTKAEKAEEELKKNDPEERQKYFQNQIETLKADYESKAKEKDEQINYYKDSHLTRLRNDTIEEAIKDIPLREGLKKGFVAYLLSTHKFEPKEIDGSIRFLNKESKEIKDIAHEFALSQEGKEYVRATSSGGGATGSRTTKTSGNNPWAKETLNLTEQGKILKENPTLAQSLKTEASVPA